MINLIYFVEAVYVAARNPETKKEKTGKLAYIVMFEVRA